MKSANDHQLDWPFNHPLELTLMNYKNKAGSITATLISNLFPLFQRPDYEFNIASGFPEFVPVRVLMDDCFTQDDTITLPLNVSTTYIEKAIRSFNSGSAAGPDKHSPQHLKELTSKQTGEAGARLLQALAALANVMLAGKVPQDILSVLYGANLVALSKPGGGIRPIAVGNILRCLVAKSAVLLLAGEIGELLHPTQLGFGTPGGCEAAVHATRRYLSATEEMSPHIYG